MTPELFDAIALTAPVSSVTLLEDRGRVVRRGAAPVEGSRARFLVSGVAPVLADKTLVVRLRAGAGRATLSDARVVRRWVPETEDGEMATERDALVLQMRDREREQTEIKTRAELADAEADGLHRLNAWTLGELADDVGRGRGIDASAFAEAAELSARERDLRVASALAWHELDEHKKATEILRERINSVANPGSRTWAGVVLDLAVESPGEIIVEIEYVVPAAMWRPAHVATLSDDDDDDGGSVNVTTSGCVWQNTGEDWDNVELSFSTERPSLGADPPVLSSDLLRVRKRDDAVVVETREQEVQTLSARGDDVTVSSDLPGIDDGGVVLALRAPAKASIPSDGRPYRVALASFETPARVELWAHPELSSAVVYNTVLVNAGAGPVLAGPVELVRAGGWIGRTKVGFVAPGEEFELSWGAEPTLRARRETEESDEESRVLSSWTTRTRLVEIRLSNLGRDARSLRVRERIPVSEIEKVKVELVGEDVTDGIAADKDGFLTWDLELGGREHRKLQYRYLLKRHSDVVGV